MNSYMNSEVYGFIDYELEFIVYEFIVTYEFIVYEFIDLKL